MTNLALTRKKIFFEPEWIILKAFLLIRIIARAITNFDIVLMNSYEGEQWQPKIQLETNRWITKNVFKMSITDREAVFSVPMNYLIV